MEANVAKLLNDQINKEFYSAYLYQLLLRQGIGWFFQLV